MCVCALKVLCKERRSKPVSIDLLLWCKRLLHVTHTAQASTLQVWLPLPPSSPSFARQLAKVARELGRATSGALNGSIEDKGRGRSSLPHPPGGWLAGSLVEATQKDLLFLKSPESSCYLPPALPSPLAVSLTHQVWVVGR